MNPKLVKAIVKGAIGLGGSALIGVLIKDERKIGELIDTYFQNKVKSN